MKIRLQYLPVLIALLFGSTGMTVAQGTAFTYQGRLVRNGVPVSGTYNMTFSVFDADSNGNQVGPMITNTSVEVSKGRFSAVVDFGTVIFTGPDRWLELGVRTNGTGKFSALSPRQLLSPTPYAVMANTASNLLGTLPAGQLSGILPAGVLGGSYPGSISFSNPLDSFTGNGTGLTGVNAVTLGGLGTASFWQAGGNTGTAAGVHFLGTTDHQALELKVNGQRAYRLEPTAGAPNVIGGASENQVAAGSLGTTISGGAANLAGAESPVNYVALGGGASNLVGNISDFSTIGGGGQNIVSDNSAFATIGGGLQNQVFRGEFVFDGATNSTIGGGYSNTTWVANSVISGGTHNLIGQSNSGKHESGSTIGGGDSNTIGYDKIKNATISGGASNFVDSHYATIAGGVENKISWNGDTYGNSIGGGFGNCIVANPGYSVIGGGSSNRITRSYSVVPGGFSNSVNASFSFAAGRLAQADHEGTFVWADSHDAIFASTCENQFSARCLGGARFVSAIDPGGVPLAGVELVAGGGSWSSLSDRNAKENFASISPREVLERVNHLPITTWNYKSQDAGIRHIGPMAQDFAAAFQVGENERRITTVDADGVALAAIQGLNEIVQEQKTELRQKVAEIQSLQQRLEVLERAILGNKVSLSSGGQ